MFYPPRSLAPPTKMRFGCTYHNTKDTQLVYGLGEQEMCILFGYLFPREEQFAAVKLEADSDCITIPLGK